MNDIDKINEELRSYKLFKIQRLNTKEQQFSELKSDLIYIKKNEIVTYILAVMNFLGIVYLVYNLVSALDNITFFEINFELIVVNFVTVLILSFYFTIKYLLATYYLKKHIKSSEDAVNYFSNESEKLKSIYENYVDNYLDQIKKR